MAASAASVSPLPAHAPGPHPIGMTGASEFGPLLRAWRSARSQSQLALSLHAGVSSRHLSYMETGRANPSREMVLTLAEALDVPLRERNVLLQAAGYAPIYRETPLDAEVMAPIREALAVMLRSMDPNPALVLNRRCDVLDANASCRWLLETFSHRLDRFAPPLNVTRILVSPDGMRPYIENWEEAAATVLGRVRRDLSEAHARDAADEALLRELEPLFETLRLPTPATPLPVLVPFTLQRGDLRLQFFTTIATLGTPLDVTLQELHIETLFPADPETKRVLTAWLAGRV